MSSYRIGRRTAAADATKSESEILRSLFEIRKRCNEHPFSPSVQDVTEITFWNCQWTQRIIHSLRKLIIRDGNRFESIKFFNCGINNSNFVEIISMILSQNATSKLIIKGRKLVDRRNERCGQVLSDCESSTNASSLDNEILAAIQDGMSANTSLKYLKLSGLNFVNVATAAVHDDNFDESDNLENFADDNTHLWCHNLINNNALLHLDFSGTNLSKSMIASLSSAIFLNTNLESLNFGRCFLEDKSLSQILHSVKEHPGLVKLDLSQNFLAKSTSTKAVDAVAELLRSKKSKLAYLDLSNQQQVTTDVDLGVEERETENARQKIAFQNALDALSTNTTLRRINLSGNSGYFLDLDNVKSLSSCLATNTRLSHVDISSCHLSPLGIQYLAENCVPNCGRNLKSLILFDDESNKNSITKNENWTTVHASLERGLQFNSTLESIGELQNTNTTFNSRSRIQHLLNANRAGRRAFQIDDLPSAAWPNILARTSRIEYDNFDDDENGSECGIEKEASLSAISSASVLFTLLPVHILLERRR